MEAEMRDYVVSFISNRDDYSCYHHIHFVTDYPLNSVGWWEDFYDAVFSLVDYSIDDNFNLRVMEITEGF